MKKFSVEKTSSKGFAIGKAYKFEKINSSLMEINLLIEKSKIEDSSLQSILDIIQKKNNEIIENDL